MINYKPLTPYIAYMEKPKQIQVCISDVSGTLQSGITECSLLIKKKQPGSITPHQFHESQLKQNRSSIVRMAMAHFLKYLQSI